FEFQPFKDWTTALSKEILATEKRELKILLNSRPIPMKIMVNTDNDLIQETGIFLLATHKGSYDLDLLGKETGSPWELTIDDNFSFWVASSNVM
ncbi:17852_t:CDS:2, partial [Entrophospora sp. SA101]